MATAMSAPPVPSVPDLCECLRDLVEWGDFAQYLPGIRLADISIIRRDKQGDVIGQKRALYEKWLQVHPNASWDDVVKALENPAVRENKIAEKVKKKYLTSLTSTSQVVVNRYTSPRIPSTSSPTVDQFTQALSGVPSWYNLGIFLGAPTTELDTISYEYSRAPEGTLRCLIEVYKCLEKKGKSLSWERIAEALQSMGNHSLAEKIHRQYIKGSTHVDIGSSVNQPHWISNNVNPPKSPHSVVKSHFAKICDLVSNTIKLGNDLCEANLISEAVLDRVRTNKSLSRYEQVDEYMSEIRKTIKVRNDPGTIASLCAVLEKQSDESLDGVVHSMRTELGL